MYNETTNQESADDGAAKPLKNAAEAARLLSSAICANCCDDDPAFEKAFAAYEDMWDADALSAFTGTAMLAATASNSVLGANRALFIPALNMGGVYEQGVSLGLTATAVDTVLAYSEGETPSLLEAFGEDPDAWRGAAAAMAAFATGLVLAASAVTHAPAGAVASQVLARLDGALTRPVEAS